jgi:hypothetical protein
MYYIGGGDSATPITRQLSIMKATSHFVKKYKSIYMDEVENSVEQMKSNNMWLTFVLISCIFVLGKYNILNNYDS